MIATLDTSQNWKKKSLVAMWEGERETLTSFELQVLKA